MKTTLPTLFVVLLLAAAGVQAQYLYTTNANNTLTITDYYGLSQVAAIPSSFNGLPVTCISNGAFEFGMLSIFVPSSITNIVDYAFAYNPELTNVTFEGNPPSADSTVFDDDTEATVYYMGTFYYEWGSIFDGHRTAPAQYSFTNQNGTITITGYNGPGGAVTIPSNIFGLTVTTIAGEAFDEDNDNTSVTSITIPDSVTSLETEAFRQAYSMTNITIGSGVTNIESPLFLECFGLNTITVDPLNSFYSSVNGVLFDKSQTVLIQYPPAGIGVSYVIPDGVTSIAAGAFEYSVCDYSDEDLSSVTIPRSVNNIGDDAFSAILSLAAVYFQGNAPAADSTVFEFDNSTVFYLFGTTGWSNTFAGVPAVLWNPLIQAGGAAFGIQSNQFGFNITGTNNFTVVVEACTNLSSPVWTSLQTVTLSNGSYYFSDPQWTNYSTRFYGLGFP